MLTTSVPWLNSWSSGNLVKIFAAKHFPKLNVDEFQSEVVVFIRDYQTAALVCDVAQGIPSSRGYIKKAREPSFS